MSNLGCVGCGVALSFVFCVVFFCGGKWWQSLFLFGVFIFKVKEMWPKRSDEQPVTRAECYGESRGTAWQLSALGSSPSQ